MSLGVVSVFVVISIQLQEQYWVLWAYLRVMLYG